MTELTEVPQDVVLLTVEQVAEQLGVSAQTVRNWESRGKLKPTHLTPGGHRRYDQRVITDLKRRQNDFELLLTVEASRVLDGVTKLLSNFRPEEKVTVTIRSDKLQRRVDFVFDSEDGLQTFTKSFKMED